MKRRPRQGKDPDRLARLLRRAGLRPTAQRLALGAFLFDGKDKHVTAEELHAAVTAKKLRVSLATVYNTLNQFLAAGLLRQVAAGPDEVYFDTNTSAHHHFYDLRDGKLTDIPASFIKLARAPAPPKGRRVEGVDVIIRLR